MCASMVATCMFTNTQNDQSCVIETIVYIKAPSHYNELKERTVNEWQNSQYAQLSRRIYTRGTIYQFTNIYIQILCTPFKPSCQPESLPDVC